MKDFSLALLFALFYPYVFFGQNLIGNSGFDEYITYVDSNQNVVYQPAGWVYPSNINHPIYVSTDRFLNKKLENNYHPDSLLIKQGLKMNYISLKILPAPQKMYTALKESLIKGCEYHLCVDVKSFKESNYATDFLIGFADTVNRNMDSLVSKVRLVISDTFCNEMLYQNWVGLSCKFKALGNEKFIVLTSGNDHDYRNILKEDNEKFILRRRDGLPRILYFIDNVSLYPEPVRSSVFDSISEGKTMVLQNVFFEFDKYELMMQSFSYLDGLADYLKQHEGLRIQIEGHTDNLGSDEYNQNLSQKRAEAVLNYMIGRGIENSRVTAIGYGAKKPVSDNDTETDRQKNRRIEIRML